MSKQESTPPSMTMSEDKIKTAIAAVGSAMYVISKDRPEMQTLLQGLKVAVELLAKEESPQLVAPDDDELLKKIHKTCLCSQSNPIGFDYGEQHSRLGKAGPGKRWLTPRDLIQVHWTKARSLTDEASDE
jgi:hypothetical protein